MCVLTHVWRRSPQCLLLPGDLMLAYAGSLSAQFLSLHKRCGFTVPFSVNAYIFLHNIYIFSVVLVGLLVLLAVFLLL